MTITDLKRQIDTTLRTTKKSFTLGEQRNIGRPLSLATCPLGIMARFDTGNEV